MTRIFQSFARAPKGALRLHVVTAALVLAACSSDSGPSTDEDPSTGDGNAVEDGDDGAPGDGGDDGGDGGGDGDGALDGGAGTCSDGEVTGDERCDDGNSASGDGCSEACQTEPGYSCDRPGRPCIVTVVCGDGNVSAGEQCDDGNATSGDGCTDACKLESNFVCEAPGEPCRNLAVCGDGRVVGAEQCDDGNTAAADGCDASCQVETGWACVAAGRPCRAAQCGDNIIAGNEECDDGNDAGNDGCVSCRVEDGWVCEGNDCRTTVCNDGTREGSEPCDDGNQVVGDGCNPYCEVEPNCGAGACTSSCGDGIRLPSDDDEECDDGNRKNGDGCSEDCKVEEGFACRDVSSSLTDRLDVAVTFRDLIAIPRGSSTRHPDFEHPTWAADEVTQGLVQNALGADSKPVYTGVCQQGTVSGPTAACPYGPMTTNANAFNQWYRDTSGVNMTKVTRITLQKPAGEPAYHFPTPGGQQLYPLDNDGFVAAGKEATGNDEGMRAHNFGFTTEIRYWFEYKGGEIFRFSGDDDVWVFVGGKLALDIGGLHPRVERTLVIDGANGTARCFRNAARTDPCAAPATRELGLQVGRIYELALFHAERHTSASNFDLTLSGFVSAHSQCDTVCGDGVATADEDCDDGQAENQGQYGGCTATCQLGPHCGDRVVQGDEGEICDDGTNLSSYGDQGCAPGCVPAPRCGDAMVDSSFGETCDDGVNDNRYGGCTPDCQLGPRCGDGEVQAGEECDDGNQSDADICTTTCKNALPL